MFEVLTPEEQKRRNIPKPTTRIKWPWRHMGVGDVVVIKDPDLASKARQRAYVYGLPYGKEFRSRTKNGVLHIWRTA